MDDWKETRTKVDFSRSSPSNSPAALFWAQRFVVTLLSLALVITHSHLATAQDRLWVTADSLNRRSCPAEVCPVVGTLFFGESAQVLEQRGEWVRITKHYQDFGCAQHGKAEFVKKGSKNCLLEHGYKSDGSFAEWVHRGFLSNVRPIDKSQPQLTDQLTDPRIKGIPKVGEYGNTERDILILRKGALKMIESGRCQEVEYGDKSSSRAGYYYVNCGGPRNLFFTADDVD